MTLDLTTDSVLQALSRLSSSRGDIEMLHSDNGPSFVKAKKYLQLSQMEQDLCDNLGKLDWDKIAESSQSVGVHNWTFSAPRSPEGNGTAESMVKLAKIALRDSFRTTKYTYDEFRTALKRAEAKINSRALTYIPADHWAHALDDRKVRIDFHSRSTHGRRQRLLQALGDSQEL
jgi:hypothetical protein